MFTADEELEVMPVTSSEVLRILGALNSEELENILDETKFSKRIASIQEKRVIIADKPAGLVDSATISVEASIGREPSND
jgi:hypothetical protein